MNQAMYLFCAFIFDAGLYLKYAKFLRNINKNKCSVLYLWQVKALFQVSFRYLEREEGFQKVQRV